MRIRSILAAIATLAVASAKTVVAAFKPQTPLVYAAFEGGHIDGMTFGLTSEQANAPRVEVVMAEGSFLYQRTGRDRAGVPVYALAA